MRFITFVNIKKVCLKPQLEVPCCFRQPRIT